mmetsp:Transcript_13686/g.32252  ORF Transcript_13686/g.32252 Transcript_13686/m.32252 type:complete len:87 (-) Transcript_13686:1266-1526(-)
MNGLLNRNRDATLLSWNDALRDTPVSTLREILGKKYTSILKKPWRGKNSTKSTMMAGGGVFPANCMNRKMLPNSHVMYMLPTYKNA